MTKMEVWVRRLERALFIAGLILVSAFAAAGVHGYISARLALHAFEATRIKHDPPVLVGSKSNGNVDFRLWSAQRIRDYLESLAGRETPLAVLRIPELRLEAPVFDGTDELTLNRGVGRIIGTAKLGELGNVGLAGHRDGFFRGLKDIKPGDVLELMMPGRTERYVVTRTQITTPEDVSVLRPTNSPALTLVTCYPFYFVGSAPQRFIVHASFNRVDSSTETTSLVREETNRSYEIQERRHK